MLPPTHRYCLLLLLGLLFSLVHTVLLAATPTASPTTATLSHAYIKTSIHNQDRARDQNKYLELGTILRWDTRNTIRTLLLAYHSTTHTLDIKHASISWEPHWRAGILPIPFGPENATLAPSLSHSTRISLLNRFLIPEQWRSLGLQHHHQTTLWGYPIHITRYVVQGIKAPYTAQRGHAMQGAYTTPHKRPLALGTRLISPLSSACTLGSSLYVVPNKHYANRTRVGLDVTYLFGPVTLVAQWAQLGQRRTPQLSSGFSIEKRLTFWPRFIPTELLNLYLNQYHLAIYSRYSALTLHADDLSGAHDYSETVIGVSFQSSHTISLYLQQRWLADPEPVYYLELGSTLRF